MFKTVVKLSFVLSALALVQCGQPEPATKAPESYPLPQGILLDGEDWQVVGEGYVYTDAPAVDKNGIVYYADVTGFKIMRENADGSLDVFEQDSGASQGMMFGADGVLYVCRNRDGKFVTYTDGLREDLYIDRTYPVIGNPNAEPEFCNDMVVTSWGDIYYTDRANRQVLIMRPGESPEVVASGYRANGIVLSPDENYLYTTDSVNPRLWAFDIRADGSLKEIQNFFEPVYTTNVLPGGEPVEKARPGTNGMTVDADGRIYVTSFVGIMVYGDDGKIQGVIPWPKDFVSNMTFGGPDFDYLYVTGIEKVYKRKMNVKGAPYFLNAE